MSTPKSVNDSLALINQFLQPVRDRMAKEGADGSFKDSDAAKVEKMEEPKAGKTEQQTLGKEQQEAAEAGGATAPTNPPNSEADGKKPTDTQGTVKTGTDDSKDNLGEKREVTIGQKVARADRLGNAILAQLEQQFGKQAAAPAPAAAPAAGTQEDQMLQAAHEMAKHAAQEYYEGFLMGLLKRAQDEFELKQANIDPKVLEQAGGISGLLDKVAVEDPAAIMPEGVLPPEVGGEAAPEGGEGVDQLAAQLEQAGVSPEDLEQAFKDVAALQEAGVTPEELASALQEIQGEAPGAEAGEAVEKAASVQANRERVEAVKAYLTA